MQTTNIEWTEMSVNPFRARVKDEWTGHVSTGHYCEKVSAGCKNCYASAMQVRFGMPTFPEARRAMPDLYLDESKLMDVLRRKKPTKIFWCDMTDMFAEFHPDEWIDKCFAVMALTPQHTHQVLTKRPERMREYLTRLRDHPLCIDTSDWIGDALHPQFSVHPFMQLYWPLPNVWLGVSVEDQKTADERIPLLLQTPAAVRWISAEPLLSSVDIHRIYLPNPVTSDMPWLMGNYVTPSGYHKPHRNPYGAVSVEALNGKMLGVKPDEYRKIDWVVVGGESGAKARPFNIQWARDIVAQCKAAGVACFVKQLGTQVRWNGNHLPFPKHIQVEENTEEVMHAFRALLTGKGGDMSEWPEDLRVREFPA